MSIGQCIKNTSLIIFGMPFYCLPCAVILVEHCTVMLMMLSLRDCQKWRKVNEVVLGGTTRGGNHGWTVGQQDKRSETVKVVTWKGKQNTWTIMV